MGKQNGATSAFPNHQMDGPANLGYTEASENDSQDPFLLQEDYRPPTWLKKIFLLKIGDWHVY